MYDLYDFFKKLNLGVRRQQELFKKLSSIELVR